MSSVEPHNSNSETKYDCCRLCGPDQPCFTKLRHSCTNPREPRDIRISVAAILIEIQFAHHFYGSPSARNEMQCKDNKRGIVEDILQE